MVINKFAYRKARMFMITKAIIKAKLYMIDFKAKTNLTAKIIKTKKIISEFMNKNISVYYYQNIKCLVDKFKLLVRELELMEVKKFQNWKLGNFSDRIVTFLKLICLKKLKL